MLQLTAHSIEQFINRWRPGVPEKEAREELLVLAQVASPTRRRTLTGDAWLYRVESERGELICMAVRDGHVITVLPVNGEGRPLLDLTPEDDMVEESQATVAACQALIASEAPFVAEQKRQLDVEKSMWANAVVLIREWRAGTRKVSASALSRAHMLLGISAGDPIPGDSSPPPKQSPTVEEARVRSAQELVDDWKRGRRFTSKALHRAFTVLGLPVPTKRP